MKNEVDKLDVDKLVPVHADLSKLNDLVKMMLLKKMHIVATNTTLNTKIT